MREWLQVKRMYQTHCGFHPHNAPDLWRTDIVRLGGVEAWRESFDRIDDIIDNTMEIENGFASAGMQ